MADVPESDNDKVQDSWLWIRGSNGQGSVSLTFATVAFVVTTLAYVLSIAEKVGPFDIRAFDVGACAAYAGPIFALYFGRRWTEARYKTDQNGG